MPKKIYLPEDARSSGIDITWTKTTQNLYIGGWYDSFVGISRESLTLLDFFDRLGITEKDCKKAFSKRAIS